MEISYSAREYKEALDNVIAGEYTDDMPIYVWARFAKILADKSNKRLTLLREVIEHYAIADLDRNFCDNESCEECNLAKRVLKELANE